MADVIGCIHTNLLKPYSVVALCPPYLKKAYVQTPLLAQDYNVGSAYDLWHCMVRCQR